MCHCRKIFALYFSEKVVKITNLVEALDLFSEKYYKLKVCKI